MAQYYQVLSQEDKGEDVQQLYQNVDEGSVQYLITTDDPSSTFQTQPVVISEPLMVVDAQPQQVIIDRSVGYQAPYVIQDSTAIEFQNTQQPVYFMTNTTATPQIVVDQPSIVVNQLIPNQIAKGNVIGTMHPAGTIKSNAAITTGAIMTQQKIVGAQVPSTISTFPEKITRTPQQVQNNDEDMGVKTTGSNFMTFQQYRREMQLQKQQNTLSQNKVSGSLLPIRRPVGGGGRHTGKPLTKPKVAMKGRQSCDDSLKQGQCSQRQTHHKNPYLIVPPHARSQNKAPVKPLPAFLHTAQIENIIANTPMGEEYSDSIRMLVLSDNGEQRLITFTLPKEACTIQEILEQVNVPFTKDTPIQVSEAHANGLNYIVAVGNVPGLQTDSQVGIDDTTSPDSSSCQFQVSSLDNDAENNLSLSTSTTKSSSPDITKELAPRIVEGQLAVCGICGYLSEDFNRCLRCKRKLPDNVKAIPAGINKLVARELLQEKKNIQSKANGIPRLNLLPKKRAVKAKPIECETVVVSSDEEEEDGVDSNTPVKNVSEHLLEKLGTSVTLSPISKEPSNVDIQKASIFIASKNPEQVPSDQIVTTTILCRTVRIGSYRFVPGEAVKIDSNCLVLKVPHPKDGAVKVIKIDNNDIVKVLISFQKSLPVIFYYLLPSVGASVRGVLDMTPGSDYYFDPLSEVEESFKRITLLPEVLSDDTRLLIQKMYTELGLFEELTYKEANDILIKTCPKELSKTVSSYSVSEIKQILMYPPEGRGRIAINTEDYMCLGTDQFLNDVIIDFYLKYLLLNLPKEQQEKIQIFSTFFYKRLTTKPLKASRKSQPTELDPNLSAAEKRHCRVKTWTKNVNIFEKDFIVVPINENSHWFLAIICFPSMNGSETMDGQPVKIEPKKRNRKSAQYKEKQVETLMCEDGEVSDKDEAEGDESELESDDSEEASSTTLTIANNANRPPIKQPCILIFDSLAGASRSRVVATLRDYLTCEYKVKMNAEKVYTKDVIKGACPKIPQQNNFTDCGLYLLQYVEQFFKDPIIDYHIPISQLKAWFPEMTVTRKREEIALLIQSLMKQSSKDLGLLPDVTFPTLNGELVEHGSDDVENKFIDPDEEDEEMEDENEDYCPTPGISAIKPSNESVTAKNDFDDQPSVLKPDLSELPVKQSNKDTLSYLKAKRIIRHKFTTEGPDAKKQKGSDSSDS